MSRFSKAKLQNAGKQEFNTDFHVGAGNWHLACHGLYSRSHSPASALAKETAFVSGVVATDPPEFPTRCRWNSVDAVANEVPPVPVTGNPFPPAVERVS